LLLKALLYIDLLMSKVPDPYDTNRVNIIGKKISTLEVVSSIITASEYVILVDPAKTAVDPKIENVEGLIIYSIGAENIM